VEPRSEWTSWTGWTERTNNKIVTSLAIPSTLSTMSTRSILQTQMNSNPACVLVIFGAAGDLTKRKLIPALYNLRKADLLSDNFMVIGVARAEMKDEEFQRRLRDDMNQFATEPVESETWNWLSERLHYLPGDFGDENVYSDLKARIDREANEQGNCIFYL